MAGARRLFLIVVLVCAIEGRVGSCARSQGIWCQSPCRNFSDTVLLGQTSRLSCSVDYIGGPPWSSDTDRTAPKPRDLKVRWYVHERQRIALNISWKQRISELKSGAISGYYLQYGFLRSKIQVDVQDVNITTFKEKRSYVSFFYECIGIEDMFLRPDDNVIVRVRALPMHLRDTKSQPLHTNITIPDCCSDVRIVKMKNREISTDSCRRCWKEREKWSTTTGHTTQTKTVTAASMVIIVHQRQPDNTVYYLLVSVVGAFCIIALLIMMAFNYEVNKSYPAIEEVLMVGDVQSGSDELGIAHKLVEKLRARYRINITCNWENQRHIEQRAQGWYTDAIKRSSLVVFILNKNDFSRQIISKDGSKPGHSELLQVFNYINNLKMAESVTFVFLVTGEIVAFRSFLMRQRSRYTVYDTSNTFWMFLRRISGRRVSKNIKLQDFFQRPIDSHSNRTHNEQAPLYGPSSQEEENS